jgi:hypothetical protein
VVPRGGFEPPTLRFSACHKSLISLTLVTKPFAFAFAFKDLHACKCDETVRSLVDAE